MLNECDAHRPEKGHDSQEGNQREATHGETEDENKPQFDGRESHIIVGVPLWVMHRCRLSSGTRSILRNGLPYSGNTQQDALQEIAAELDVVPHVDSSQRAALVATDLELGYNINQLKDLHRGNQVNPNLYTL